jgi:predicted nucleic acid-binding protein
MVLVDSSVWIDHFRKANAALVALLDSRLVSTHPFVVGELALGHQKQQRLIIQALGRLKQLPAALDTEVLTFIESAKLAGSGICHVDAHLLVSAKLAREKIWTRDKRLLKQLARLDLRYE